MGPVDKTLADLVQKGQDSGVCGRHLPAQVLSRVAYAAFAIAADNLSGEDLSAWAARVTSLLILGGPDVRARALVHSGARSPRGTRSGGTRPS